MKGNVKEKEKGGGCRSEMLTGEIDYITFWGGDDFEESFIICRKKCGFT